MILLLTRRSNLHDFSLSNFRWFHGRIEREYAEGLLKSPPLTNGKYLVRESIRYIGDYTLSLLTLDPFNNEPKIDHYRMLRNLSTGTIYIDDEYQFDHIYEIINVSSVFHFILFIKTSKLHEITKVCAVIMNRTLHHCSIIGIGYYFIFSKLTFFAVLVIVFCA